MGVVGGGGGGLFVEVRSWVGLGDGDGGAGGSTDGRMLTQVPGTSQLSALDL